MPSIPKKPKAGATPLSPKDRADLKASGLTDMTIKANRIHTDKKKRALVFPYRDLAGKLNSFARTKPHNPRVVEGKPVKYEQPKGSPPRAYFPVSSVKKLSDGSGPIYITEGEKKSLALSQLKLAAIGIGGVWCWKSKDSADLIDDLAKIDWTGRTVYIVFDYDEKPDTREHVKAATMRLAKALRLAGAAQVLSVDIPPGSDGDKQGVDDFIVASGAAAFRELTKTAQTAETRSGSDGNSSIYLIKLRPPELTSEAYCGFAGEFINAVAPYTEATDAGILAHLLPAVGTMIGSGPHVWAGNEQPARLNTVLVGPTSTGRKGTSLVPVDLLMKRVNPEFWKEQRVSGLSSGEGLIQKVSDNREKNADGEWEETRVDKRLYVVEPEFSKVLAQSRREGNILSQILRESYDSGDLGVLTRNPLAAKNSHISITGHITPEELRDRFTNVEMANGFGNRFLWFVVVSEKCLPCADPIPDKVFNRFTNRLKAVLQRAAKLLRIELSADAKKLYEAVYRDLRADKPGLAGALTARGESVVLRVALIYALLDTSKTIQCRHLEAALAVWRYNEESAQALFKSKSGTQLTDDLYRLLKSGPKKTTDFYKHMSISSEKLRDALDQLERNGLVRRTKRTNKGRGRPAEYWERCEA